ncbi:rab-GTPase-TBC domain-containing protein [Sporodiniella umbellata]|nr:rab-GTPase-TBC domain-containing protein [Sporodiniella umbellata]
MLTDAVELGENVTDITQLYSDAVFVLGFKELYQRLEEGQKTATDKFEWDTDYFMLVEENDVNFLLEEPSDGEKEDYCNDLMFEEDSSSLAVTSEATTDANGASTPTTPSSSKSLQRISSLGRSRSTSSLSANSAVSGPYPPTNSNTGGGNNTALKLPLFLREQDVNYQKYRLSLFSQLLRQYPASRNEILHHAKVDIPPLLRGKIWAAVLGVQGNPEYTYGQAIKSIDLLTERQIELDVPRCHQYNQLLASSTGHERLRRLLKAWVAANPNLVYWQAFASLQKFIPKFLNNFFLSDNTSVLQEYLAVFRHLLSFHDPELSSHLDYIGFMPDLYAIPWFLTLFTHVFPLDKIYHLWDKFLVGPSSLPLFAGIAILRQIRDTLLGYEFNDCIVLFSDSFPKVDIEKCVQSALNMCKVTPPSAVARIHGAKSEKQDEAGLTKHWESPISIETKKSELSPRLSIYDLERILPYSLILDIRSESDYTNALKKLNKKYHVVVANENDSSGPEVS